MSVATLLNAAPRDTVGSEVVLRVIGSREAPADMVIQIAIDGTAQVRIQGRITREAPWLDLGQAHATSALVHVKAVQFLRALACEVQEGTKVSAWADWAW
jgi:hypothetical protein